jgi:hypothetical protein
LTAVELLFYNRTNILIVEEAMNLTNTQRNFALRDILGNQGSGFLTWPMILSLAFCGMDIAGIAKILASPKEDTGNKSSWYLLGAWVLAAAMNAGLTWWGVSVAIYNQPAHAVMIIDPMTYVTVVPVFVAVMVWVIRVLIIGILVTSFNLAPKGNRQQREPVQKKVFGFRVNKQAPPPGYKPVPSRARMDYEGFPR